MDLGVLLSLPVESIAIRAVIATVASVALARLLLRAGIRTAAIRVMAAVLPALALVVVIAIAASDPRLPFMMVPVDARDGLAIRVAEGYLYFAPMVFPWLLVAWAAFVAIRLGRRILVARATQRRAFAAVSHGSVPGDVREIAVRVASRLHVPEPFVTVVDHAPGGAYVVGRRRPVIVLDAELVGRLDADELEGVLAHELAHVKRRDNLVAGVVGVVRDAVFFAPGTRWAVRHLHRERELAADQVAVAVTRRPGALASGLLKVLDHAPRTTAHACASLAPSAGLVDRVRVLVDAPHPPSTHRRVLELGALGSVVTLAITSALVLPSAAAGVEHERDAVAVVWSPSSSDAPVDTGGPARVFDVYRRNALGSATAGGAASVAATRDDERAIESRRSTLYACADDELSCPAARHRLSLGLRPRPVVTVDRAVTRAWQATPVLDGTTGGSGLQMYWLARRG
ncbi:MAG: M56 family metallopeptidase [Nitriliruptoraceae bacterium]